MPRPWRPTRRLRKRCAEGHGRGLPGACYRACRHPRALLLDRSSLEPGLTKPTHLAYKRSSISRGSGHRHELHPASRYDNALHQDPAGEAMTDKGYHGARRRPPEEPASPFTSRRVSMMPQSPRGCNRRAEIVEALLCPQPAAARPGSGPTCFTSFQPAVALRLVRACYARWTPGRSDRPHRIPANPAAPTGC